MADEKILIEIEVDNDQAIKDINEQNAAIEKLQQENKELAAQGQKNSTQYQKNAAQIQKLNSARKQNIKLISSEKGSLNELRANLARLTTQRNAINTSTRQGAAEFQRLNKEILKQNNAIKQAEQAGGDFRRSVGNYQSALSGISPTLGNVANGFQTMTRSALAFIATPIGAVIAALGAVVGALTQYFRDNVEGQNELLKITNYLSAAWGVFTDLVSDLGKTIFEAFKDPKQAIVDFGTLILNNLINRWEGFVGILTSSGQIISAFFNKMAAEVKIALADVPIIGKAIDLDQAVKDSQQATKDIEEGFVSLGQNSVKAVTGLEDPLATVNGLMDKFNDNLDRANTLSQTQIDLRKQEREVASDIAQLEVEIAENRLKAKQEDQFTDKERIAFLEEAKRLTDEQFALEERLARLKYEAKVQENALSKSSQEDLVEEDRLLAELIRKEQARLNANRKLETELQTLKRQLRAEEQAEINAQAAEEERLRQEQLKAEEAAEKERTRILKAEAKVRIQTEKAVANSKAQLLNSGFVLAKALAGKNEKLVKAIGLVEVAVNTARGIMNAFATLPYPAAIPAAISVAATGAAQAIAITSSSPSGGSIDTSLPSSTGTATPDTSAADQALAEQAALESAIANLGLTVSVTEINDAQNNVQVTQDTSTI